MYNISKGSLLRSYYSSITVDHYFKSLRDKIDNGIPLTEQEAYDFGPESDL